MIKGFPAVLFLAFACLFALCTALPSAVLSQSQSVSAQTKPDVPRTLLGKFYGRRWETAQACLPSQNLTVDPADRKDADAHRSTSTDFNDTSRSQFQNDGDEHDAPRVTLRLPLPLVVNLGLESGPMRLGLTRSKRPMRCSRYSDDVPQRGSKEMMPMDGHAQRVHQESPVVFTPGGKKFEKPRDVSTPVRRSKREEGKKSRLTAGYYEMAKRRDESRTEFTGSPGLVARVGI